MHSGHTFAFTAIFCLGVALPCNMMRTSSRKVGTSGCTAVTLPSASSHGTTSTAVMPRSVLPPLQVGRCNTNRPTLTQLPLTRRYRRRSYDTWRVTPTTFNVRSRALCARTEQTWAISSSGPVKQYHLRYRCVLERRNRTRPSCRTWACKMKTTSF